MCVCACTHRGLPANIIGIMPEKTIKLAGNDFFRGVFKVDDPSVRHTHTNMYIHTFLHTNACIYIYTYVTYIHMKGYD